MHPFWIYKENVNYKYLNTTRNAYSKMKEIIAKLKLTFYPNGGY